MSGPPTTKKIRRAESLVVVAVVQIGWFACVLGAAQGLDWLGPVVVAVLVALYCSYSLTWRSDLAFSAILLAVGAVIDSLQSHFGFLTFYGRPEWWPAWLAPPWILALWFHFGNLRWALFRPLATRPWLAAACGAVGAPVAYLGGARFGAASLHASTWPSLVAVAVAWAVFLPLAARWTWRHLR